MPITIDLLRHGACEGGEIFRGHTDVALSDDGWAQMRSAAAGVTQSWSEVWSSPLQRCRVFAGGLAATLAVPHTVDKRLQEISFGTWDGRLREELQHEQPEILERFYRDPLGHAPPEGEALQVFADRVIAGFTELVRDSNQEHVLLVSHGGTMRAILCWALGMPLQHFFRLDVPYAAISRLRIYRDEEQLYPQLLSHNLQTVNPQ